MSEMFSVRVKAVSEKKASFVVESVHPDSGPPVGTATFALMLMYDPIADSGYSNMKAFDHLERSPLAQEVDLHSYLDPAWIVANACGYVKSAKVTGGVLEVVPTHPAWISHLRKGMQWRTAAYDNGPGDPCDAREPIEGDPVPSRDPAAGFRVGKPNDEKLAVPEAFIALHGPNRYVAHPVITDPAEMREAAKKMIGQPILYVPKRGPSKVETIVSVEKDWMMLYSEFAGGGGWGSGSHAYDEIASMGRAWLRERLEPKPAPTPKPKAKKKAKARTKQK